MRHYNIPIFVPHFGCPHDCSFCNQKKITGQSTGVTASEVKKTISEYIKTMHGDIQAAFFGGSFTGIDEQEQISLLEAADEFYKNGDISGIRVSTRPDYISEPILERLKKYHVTAVELGVQSMDNGVLAANNRGHIADDVVTAVELIGKYGIEIGLQMMTGLYKSTPEKDFETGVKIAELNPSTVRIYPTVVLEGTHLAKLYNSGEYVPYSLDTTVELCSRIYSLFESKNIRIIRMGLQSTDIICEKGSILGGAYHSSFGELVLSRLWRNREEEYVLKHIGQEDLTMNVPKKYVSQAVGNKRENIKYIKEKYGVNIKITGEQI